MEQELLKEYIQIGVEALGIVGTLSGAAFALYKYSQFKKATYYINQNVFTDRSKSLADLIKKIKNKSNIINVFGKRGIGKSSFLRFFCDFVNGKLTKENRETVGKKIKKPYGRAFYIEISGSGSKSVEEQIIDRISDCNCTLSKFAEQTVKRLWFYKRIFIVLDNINNAALGRDVESIIDIFLSHSRKYYIIAGSVEKQPLLNAVNVKRIDYIELNIFGNDDISQFVNKNGNKSIPVDCISSIIDFSDGLPILVSLLLNNNMSTVAYNRERMEKYIERIINDLQEEDSRLAIYIGYLSITNAIIPLQLIKIFFNSLSTQNLESLENSALIEYDRKTYTIKMHELFRNCICSIFPNVSTIVNEISRYYASENKLLEQSYYLVMAQTDDSDGIILKAIHKAIKDENFSYLLLMGEHYKRLYDWQPSSAFLNQNTFLALVYGYIEGLIGVGDYPAAREVIDKCKISARNTQSDIQFRFSLLTAQLYHLQNNYKESIATYEILLNNIQSNNQYLEYQTRCYWGIAHAYRHEGYDYDIAIEYYDKAIKSAVLLNQKSEIIKSMREKLVILMLRGQKEQADKLYNEIGRYIEQLPGDGYFSTQISYLKSKAMYIKTMCGGDTEMERELLDKAFQKYKLQKKRLQYNILFDMGEYYRRQKSYVLAAENYNLALAFSRRNLDRNLETMALIALAINDICGCQNVKNIFNEKQDSIIKAIDDSTEYNLVTNKLLADMVLSYLTESIIDGETINTIRRLGYVSALRTCETMTKESFQQLDLFLM
jgi:hypothetical protein